MPGGRPRKNGATDIRQPDTTAANVGQITNYFKFVQHVLMMDTTFPDSRQTWRTAGSPLLHHAAYIAIILPK